MMENKKFLQKQLKKLPYIISKGANNTKLYKHQNSLTNLNSSQINSVSVSRLHHNKKCHAVLQLQAKNIIKKYYQNYNKQTSSFQLIRSVYDQYLQLVHKLFIQYFEQSTSQQMSIILNKLVYLYEVDCSQMCQIDDSQMCQYQQKNMIKQQFSHKHQQHQYRIYAYECLSKKYTQTLNLKQSIRGQVQKINKQIQLLNNSLQNQTRIFQINKIQKINKQNSQKVSQKRQQRQKYGECIQNLSENVESISSYTSNNIQNTLYYQGNQYPTINIIR